jgi:hypothetical protein
VPDLLEPLIMLMRAGVGSKPVFNVWQVPGEHNCLESDGTIFCESLYRLTVDAGTESWFSSGDLFEP